MARLTDTQLVILSTASQRNDSGVDLPANVTGEALRKAVEEPPFALAGTTAGVPETPPLNCPALLNLSFTLHGRTTRATGGTMREFNPGSVRCPFAVTRIPCTRGLLGRATNPLPP